MPIDPQEQNHTTLEELSVSTMYEIEAVINILERKWLLTKDEVLEEIMKISEKRWKAILIKKIIQPKGVD